MATSTATTTVVPNSVPYALGQLLSLSAPKPPGSEPDPAKITLWQQFLANLPQLSIGDRKALKNYPEWVTPQVLAGGFASGNVLAQLKPGEIDSYEMINTPANLQRLQALLQSNKYRAEAPEHTALLALVYLTQTGHQQQAMEIFRHLQPFMHQLKFYPEPAAEPVDMSGLVEVKSIQDVLELLKRQARANKNTAADRVRRYYAMVAAKDWADVTLQLVRLFADHNPFAPEQGGITEPFRQRAAELAELVASVRQTLRSRAEAAAKEFGQPSANDADRRAAQKAGRPAVERFLYCMKTNRPHSQHTLPVLLRCLEAVSTNGTPDARQLASLQRILNHHRAHPDHYANKLAVNTAQAERLQAFLDEPARVRDRLEQTTANVHIGIRDVEAVQAQIPTKLSKRMVRLLRQAWRAPIEALVDSGVVPSMEQFGDLLNKAAAADIASSLARFDPPLAGIVYETYRTFALRRSLLLVNLQHQVVLDELPWYSALATISPLPQIDYGRFVALALRRWPHVMLPNKFVSALTRAGYPGDLVEELAADIFMGAFTPKFTRLAQGAYELLKDTLYAKYYQLKPINPSVALVDTCTGRLPPRDSVTSRFTAYNGATIEQMSILTAHNLAELVTKLSLNLAWVDLAKTCWAEILSELKRPAPTFHNQLRQRRRLANAWRNLVFYLSLPRSAEVERAVMEEMREQAAEKDESGRATALVDSLIQAADGGEGHEYFVGWYLSTKSKAAAKGKGKAAVKGVGGGSKAAAPQAEEISNNGCVVC